jgi:hypothetical protein
MAIPNGSWVGPGGVKPIHEEQPATGRKRCAYPHKAHFRAQFRCDAAEFAAGHIAHVIAFRA